MDNNEGQWLYNSSHMSRHRRFIQIFLYTPALIAIAFFSYPTSSDSSYIRIYGTFYYVQYIAGFAFAIFATCVWLMRYLQYGILFPLPSKLLQFSSRLFSTSNTQHTAERATIPANNESASPPPQMRDNETAALAFFEVSSQRISREISALSRRNNANLVFGFFTAACGIVLIALFLRDATVQPSNWESFLIHFAPRLSLAIFVELFAYFFLGLYRNGLAEIKYYQNELTNIESRNVALEAAKNSQSQKTLSEVIKTISKTERNIILEKGQTTAAIQIAKIENANNKSLMEAFSALLKTRSKADE